MKEVRLFVILVSVALLLSQCYKTPVARVAVTPPSPPVQTVNGNVLTMIFTHQTIYAGNTRVSFPNLTEAIVDSGSVQAYFKHSDSTNWVSLPYSDGINSCQILEPLSAGSMVLFTSVTLVDYDFRFDLTAGK
jgi:hypothetical protein